MPSSPQCAQQRSSESDQKESSELETKLVWSTVSSKISKNLNRLHIEVSHAFFISSPFVYVICQVTSPDPSFWHDLASAVRGASEGEVHTVSTSLGAGCA